MNSKRGFNSFFHV